jgi:hypothetical protein
MTQIYTIGYEGTDIERFVQTLKIVGVEQLVDVRAVALSRKKGFSKNGLRNRLEADRSGRERRVQAAGWRFWGVHCNAADAGRSFRSTRVSDQKRVGVL